MVISVARRSLQQIRKDVTAILHRAYPAESNERLMAIQARLVELLRQRGHDSQEVAWCGGPTLARLEREPLPYEAAKVRLAIARLDPD